MIMKKQKIAISRTSFGLMALLTIFLSCETNRETFDDCVMVDETIDVVAAVTVLVASGFDKQRLCDAINAEHKIKSEFLNDTVNPKTDEYEVQRNENGKDNIS